MAARITINLEVSWRAEKPDVVDPLVERLGQPSLLGAQAGKRDNRGKRDHRRSQAPEPSALPIHSEPCITATSVGNLTWQVGGPVPGGTGVLYTRSARAESAGPKEQALKDYCERQGLHPRWIVAVVGSGTGSLVERPDLNAVLTLCSEPSCKWLLVWDTDRLSRDFECVASFTAALRATGVTLHVVR